ncbi:hypothetical protein [Yoonia sp.]|uniref:hypothetical protein n=1 Tax=Yoonia sp. TaxID=2212373 RepID=UPI0025EEF7A3|nr:hypothetical protein [Yoonia sp.]
MSMKTLIFVAAAIAATGSFATADTYFEFGPQLAPSDTLELGLITADGDGVVEIYEYHTGVMGALLGSERLHAGANPDVRINTGVPVRQDVIAVVKIGGQVVATKQFDIDS